MPYLPLEQKPYTNIESVGNKAAFESFIDCDKSDLMQNTFREGLGGDTNDYFTDLGTSAQIDGIFEVINQDFAAVFSDGKLFKVESDGTATEITGVTINADTPVSYADFGVTGYFCNNSRILKWNYADATCSYIVDGDAPTDATFVGFIDQYLLALRADSARFEHSDVGLPDTWLGEFNTEETRPDNAVGLFCNFGQIFIPGTNTLATWIDSGDADSPFERIPGSAEERGSLSPYSFTQIDNSYFFLDTERRVIRLAGNQPQVISNDFDDRFQSLTDVTDAIGYHYTAEGNTKYVLHFPTDEKTYTFDYKRNLWSEWSHFNNTTATRDNYLGRMGAYIVKWNKYIIGSRVDGKLYIASNDYVTDEGDNIIAEFVTGRYNHGTSRYKTPTKMVIEYKRGAISASDSYEPQISISWRDNGSSVWKSEKNIVINMIGDPYSYKTLKRLGKYRDRQYRVKMQGNDTTIISMEEIIE